MRNYVKEMAVLSLASNSVNMFHEVSMSYLAKKFFPDKDISILELGVGTGQILLPLAKIGYKNLFAIDIDAYGLPAFSLEGLKCIQADVSRSILPLKDACVDVVILFHLIEHLINAETCLLEIARVLKKGGLLVLSTPDWLRNYKRFFSDPTHVHPYDKKAIDWLLRCCGFDSFWIRNFGVAQGLGRFWPLWKAFKFLMFSGVNIIAVARKAEN